MRSATRHYFTAMAVSLFTTMKRSIPDRKKQPSAELLPNFDSLNHIWYVESSSYLLITIISTVYCYRLLCLNPRIWSTDNLLGASGLVRVSYRLLVNFYKLSFFCWTKILLQIFRFLRTTTFHYCCWIMITTESIWAYKFIMVNSLNALQLVLFKLSSLFRLLYSHRNIIYTHRYYIRLRKFLKYNVFLQMIIQFVKNKIIAG